MFVRPLWRGGHRSESPSREMADSVGTEKCRSNAVTARGPGPSGRGAGRLVGQCLDVAALGDGDDHAGQLVDRERGDASRLLQRLGHQDGELRAHPPLVLDEELRDVRLTDGVQGELRGDERPLPVDHEVVGLRLGCPALSASSPPAGMARRIHSARRSQLRSSRARNRASLLAKLE